MGIFELGLPGRQGFQEDLFYRKFMKKKSKMGLLKNDCQEGISGRSFLQEFHEEKKLNGFTENRPVPVKARWEVFLLAFMKFL
ncbi:MAG: hypothetical protein ACO1O1_07920 [Adhaeribacter sp.]